MEKDDGDAVVIRIFFPPGEEYDDERQQNSFH